MGLMRLKYHGGNAMKGKIGCPTTIVTLVPHMRELAKGETKKLSAEANIRLKIFDFYRQKSAQFSGTGQPEVLLTCKRFGIHRSYFYYWKERYDTTCLSSLENRPTIPKKRRLPEYSRELVEKVRKIRKADSTYSARKIRPILLREMPAESVPSVATLGRLISRENLFFRADVKRRKKHSKAARKAHERKRKPHNLAASAPGQVIEFDMKHIYLLGQKQYAFCAIDLFNREALIHIASSPSSLNAKAALKKVVERFGTGVSIVNDNGSENMAHPCAVSFAEQNCPGNGATSLLRWLALWHPPPP